jgi:hypothetical protein
MIKNLSAAVLLWLAASPIGQAQAEDTASADLLTPPVTKSPDRYNLSFRMGFNITADFKNIGAFSPQGHLVPIPGQGAVSQPANPNGDAVGNRTYQDGYVWVDSSGNALGYSRYWGYDNLSQVNLRAGTISMHTSSSPGTDSNDRAGDPQMGLEFTYNRRLGNSEKWSWGLEASFNYMNVSIHDSHVLHGTGTLITDSFQLPPEFGGGGFVIPPPPPYSHGPFLDSDTGNTVINATPTRQPLSNFATSIAGSRQFDADVFGSRLGPYAELPLGSKVNLGFSGGLALAVITSDFSYHETVIFNENIGTGPVMRSSAGSSSEADVLVGGYVSATCNVALSEKWNLFGGAQFQSLGHYTHRIGDREAQLDLSESVFVTVGLSFSF